jgi:hypothetical protein
MIEWEVIGGNLQVYDDNSVVAVTVTGPDLAVEGDGSGLPRPVDATVDVLASELRLPMGAVDVTDRAGDVRYELGNETNSLDLIDGEYVLDVDAEVRIFLRASGPFSVRTTTESEEVVLTFEEPSRVTLGFRSRYAGPTGTLTVDPTPSGLATALSHSHAAHETTGPDRSFPTFRGHPPLFHLGDRTEVPQAVAQATVDTGIELTVPSSVPSLFVLAPLSYYLGATVRTTDREQPTLSAPDVGVEHNLASMPELERDATRVLRRVFFLDCLVRNAGPYGTTLAESSLLDALELDADRLYDATLAERLRTYLDVPHAAVERRLPDWHLSTYVEPTAEHVDALPFLLDDLALVYTPKTSELEGAELVERSLGDFYRGRRSGAGQVASVDILKPELRSSRVHGWLAAGTPIDVFKSAPAAYQNRLAHLGRDRETTKVVVVLNDREMDGEHVDVEPIYRDRAKDLPIDLTVRDHLSTVKLARTFESDVDFVHYIGHCEEAGLRCPNGYLSATSLSTCNAQAFFLNACGSYYEGIELVEKGAVAGAVTFSQVLNDHAVKVGSAFARLLVHGFSVERAMQLARRRIMMGKDYAVVGDGTHVVTQNETRPPATATLEAVGEEYLLTYDQYAAGTAGEHYHPHVGDGNYSYLCGSESEFVLEETEVVDFLGRAEMPVVYGGDFYWSDELHEAFTGQGPV